MEIQEPEAKKEYIEKLESIRKERFIQKNMKKGIKLTDFTGLLSEEDAESLEKAIKDMRRESRIRMRKIQKELSK